jgi:hypothetical protein
MEVDAKARVVRVQIDIAANRVTAVKSCELPNGLEVGGLRPFFAMLAFASRR